MFFKKLLFRSERLHFYYYLLREYSSSFDKPSKTPFGFYFAGNKSMAQGDFEKEETQFVMNILEDYDVFVNIGANIGYYTCLALHLGKKVIAFEPIQGNLRILYKNLSLNNFKNFEIFPLALSDESRIMNIYGHGTGASLVKGWADCPEDHKQFIPVSTLDTIMGDRLSGKKVLYLIDVEGAEFSLLKGASRQLSMSPRPAWIVEITDQHHPGDIKDLNYLETFELFWNRGYNSYLAKDGFPDILRTDIEKWISLGKNPWGFHNYFFV